MGVQLGAPSKLPTRASRPRALAASPLGRCVSCSSSFWEMSSLPGPSELLPRRRRFFALLCCMGPRLPVLQLSTALRNVWQSQLIADKCTLPGFETGQDCRKDSPYSLRALLVRGLLVSQDWCLPLVRSSQGLGTLALRVIRQVRRLRSSPYEAQPCKKSTEKAADGWRAPKVALRAPAYVCA